jgi:hypothetical protein
MLTFSVIFLLVAVIGWQQYRIAKIKSEHAAVVEQLRIVLQQEANRQQQIAEQNGRDVLRFAWGLRKTVCAKHIGELTGEKHDSAVRWFQPFYDEDRPMSEEDLTTCKEF